MLLPLHNAYEFHFLHSLIQFSGFSFSGRLLKISFSNCLTTFLRWSSHSGLLSIRLTVPCCHLSVRSHHIWIIGIRKRNSVTNLIYCLKTIMWLFTNLSVKTGTTQRDGMGREEGGGFRMGNTCIPVVDSFWYLANLIQLCKF